MADRLVYLVARDELIQTEHFMITMVAVIRTMGLPSNLAILSKDYSHLRLSAY